MGQTLTHGIYLPDEGERNCYDGLAGNWQLLDGAVGTVAEHTTALSGKAPLVHTHTKSDITDFPAYGNAAGTICEGNDSRLSDARTPVAHTHTKADITDLFNSANTWSGDNSYSKAITVAKNSDTNFFLNTKHTAAELGSLPRSDQSITWAFKDKNDDNLCYARVYYETTGGNSFRIFVRNKYTAGAPSTSGTADYAYFAVKINADKSKEGVLRGTFKPYDNNTYDLGSSSYQWNNLYAKNYYYNGVAWGLNKANTWTGENTFQAQSIYQVNSDPRYVYKSSSLEIGVQPTGSHTAASYWLDKNGNELGFTRFVEYNNSAQTYEIRLSNKATNGALDPTGNDIATNIQLALDPNGVSKLNLNVNALRPAGNGVSDLGDSTHRWKTLNGVNPGALSLPDTLGTSGTENVNYFNVIGYLNNTGTLATIPSTATYDGWLYINAKDGADSYIIIDDSPASFGTSVFGNNGLGAQGIGLLCLMCPIRKGHAYNVRIKSAGIVSARIYPAQGNV